ncbi:MAG: hypothetical protein AAB430_00685 [Patescibacteria group bacterium]
MSEQLQDRTIYVAPCGQKNPIELFFDEAGYPWKCQQHVQPATHKVLFLSPKGEVEGDFGPKYYCGECVPNIYEVAANQDAYLDVFYGKI